ncbi:MAG TPA: type IV toxin-antitoxin system AbiEi family antitoxin domain-containing protein [Solirubrobacterales bacterium]|nr:type IV toxin-antitoxin system AbiEi family antitoxin domain-containing protein [Solirubrobacterales bacterium]
MKNESAIRHLSGAQLHTESVDRKVEGLARRQHAVVSRRQLLALGMGRRAITGRLQRGQLHELHRGVYVVGVRRISRKGRWMGAVLACGEGAVLSHHSAARLWRLVPPAHESAVVTSARTQPRRPGITCHRAVLYQDEWLIQDGIPVTSPFRTIFDLAGVVAMRDLERAFHEAEAQRMTDRVSLPMLLERYPGRRGSKKVRTLLQARGPVGITRNEFEEAFVALVDRHGLPRPRMNADLAVRGRFYEIDALWETQRVAVELDSRGVHGTVRRFESDRQRDRILVAEGYRTMRITWRQLREERDDVMADLKAALEQTLPTHTYSAR